MSSAQSIIDQMAEFDITGLQPQDLIIDGKLHRFKPEGTRSRRAWYVLFKNTLPDGTSFISGAFGDWGLDLNLKVKLDGIRLSDEERTRLNKQTAAKKREAEKERKEKARQAALRARRWWPKLAEKGQSPYLDRKRVKAHGVRFSPKKAMVIPVVDMGGYLHGFQIIHAEPRLTVSGDLIEKDFFPFGMDPKGHFHQIGPVPSKDSRILVVEGYATGSSLFEATGYTVFVAFNVGNLASVAKIIRETYPDNPIAICADDDYQTLKPIKNPGVTEAKKVAKSIKGLLAIPKFKNRTDQKWTDFNDLHLQHSLVVVRKQIHAVFDPPEKVKGILLRDEIIERLSRTNNGDLRADINNARLVIEHDPRWSGVLAYSDFAYSVFKIKPPPFENNTELGEWTDQDTSRLRCWLAEHYNFTPKKDDADNAVEVAAQANRFHPVRDYLSGLVWDGTPRLATWLSDFTESEQSEYTAKVGTKWLVGAVARVMRPPVKMDSVLILEGGQGKGKSTALRILGGDWFSDTHFELGQKDGYQQMRGVWIYEMAELDAFNKAESTRAKAFFSTESDNYRASYGRRNGFWPRQCVFVGSTNQDHYLKDVTGNRRYWPVRCQEINLDALREIRDQLWAEAVVLYKANEPWWVIPEELGYFEAAQEERFSEDAWESVIESWLKDPDQRSKKYFTTAEIFQSALGMDNHQMKPPEQTRIGLIMKRLGWSKRRISVGDSRPYMYVRPADQVIAQPKVGQLEEVGPL